VISKDIAAREPLHSLTRLVCASHRTHYTCRSKGKVVITLCLSYCMPCLRPTPTAYDPLPTTQYHIDAPCGPTDVHDGLSKGCARPLTMCGPPNRAPFCVGRYLPVLARPQKPPPSLQRSVVRTRDGLWNQ
jgi:hypothetical protein